LTGRFRRVRKGKPERLPQHDLGLADNRSALAQGAVRQGKKSFLI